MQTFLPYYDFAKSAACLDRSRLGKQRLETLQLLRINLQGPQIAWRWAGVNGAMWQEPAWFVPLDSGDSIKATPWYNHPAARMWRGHERWLAVYGEAICFEWTSRKYEDNVGERIALLKSQTVENKLPSWLGDEQLHSSHRAALLAKKLSHYERFGWSEEPKIKYWWPV